MKLTLSERFRALFQEPMAAVRKMGVSEGQRVADIGAGVGYFTIPAAFVVGQIGVVYAAEPDAGRSARITKRAANEGLANLHVLNAGVEQLGEITSESIHLAFSAFSLHHFSDRRAGLAEVRRILRTGGSFYVWDRVPGFVGKHGTRTEELSQLSEGFARFELLSTGRTVRARFTK